MYTCMRARYSPYRRQIQESGRALASQRERAGSPRLQVQAPVPRRAGNSDRRSLLLADIVASAFSCPGYNRDRRSHFTLRTQCILQSVNTQQSTHQRIGLTATTHPRMHVRPTQPGPGTTRVGHGTTRSSGIQRGH